MPIQLDMLQNCPQFLPQVANGLWDEFKVTFLSYFPFQNADQLAAYMERLYIHAPEPLPNLIVHNNKGVLVGFCGIVTDDLGAPWNETITHTPWLANVYVAPQYRSQGVGDIMMTYMTKNVFPLMHTPVYLWTHTLQLREWYRKRHGFQFVQTLANYAHHPEIYIMKI